MIKGHVRGGLKRVLRIRPSPPPNSFANGQPQWKALLARDAKAWARARTEAKKGPHVLIATSVGGYAAGTIIESLVAVALTLRGAYPHILLCDQVLPACQQAMISQVREDKFAEEGPTNSLCPSCFPPGYAMYRSLGLRVSRYTDWLSPKDRRRAAACAATVPIDEVNRFTADGLAIGEHAYAGALRYYARGDLGAEPQGERVLRRYLEASLLTMYATRNLLDRLTFESSVFNHGIYVPQGMIGEVARQKGVRVVNWNPAYRKHRFIFAHNESYHHALLSEPTSNWENIPWSDGLEKDLMDYLKSRWEGTRDWIWFHEKPEAELSAIADQLGVDFSRPTIGVLTNVMWDAQLHYRANAFPGMLDWTLRTIRYFASRPELQLIIRIHPAEIRGTLPSRQPLLAEIQKAFPQLPPNVFVISPESPISTYAAMLACNAVVVYGTKTGVELTSLGLPVIVAGEAWIRNKGLTMDASSPEEYFALLDRLPLPGRLDEKTTLRARKYAYHFFFRRMIPLGMIKPTSGWPPYRLDLNSLDDLQPGRSQGLDVICDGILKGTEFVYPAESRQEYFE